MYFMRIPKIFSRNRCDSQMIWRLQSLENNEMTLILKFGTQHASRWCQKVCFPRRIECTGFRKIEVKTNLMVQLEEKLEIFLVAQYDIKGKWQKIPSMMVFKRGNSNTKCAYFQLHCVSKSDQFYCNLWKLG